MTNQQQPEPTIRVRDIDFPTGALISRQAAKIEVLEMQLENSQNLATQAQEAIRRLTAESIETIKRLEDQLLEAKTPAPEPAVVNGRHGKPVEA
jgi:hypothetical protein